MFKKTLVTLTALGLASNAMALSLQKDVAVPAAGTVHVLQTPATSHVATIDAYAATAFIIHLDADYSDGDTVQLTYSGAAIDEDNVFPTTSIALVKTTGKTCADGQRAAFAGFNSSTQTVTYVLDTSAVTDGCTMAIPVISADGASLAANDTFSVSGVGSTAYGTLESFTAVKLIDVAVDNITQTVATPLDGIVDVENGRYQFTTAPGTATDVVTIATTEGANAFGAADLLGATHVISGDFGWTKKTAADGTVSRVGVAVSNAATGPVVTDTTVTWTSAAGTVSNAVTLTPQTGDDKKVLPATTYSLATAYTYDNGPDAAVLNGSFTAALGAWTLNGASVTAYGIPNQAAVTPFLWVQNKGTSNGDITVDVRCDGASISGIAAGQAAPMANTSIGVAVQAGVDAAGTCTVGSRYDAVVTVNGPAADMTVNAGYRVTAADGSNDRLSLETSDSLDGDGYE
ncbi:hypothetical protein OAK05_00385 [Gammaproteobacteria bacterium]|nr:hypothetical protein [Gammaproteobacteria bacterium]